MCNILFWETSPFLNRTENKEKFKWKQGEPFSAQGMIFLPFVLFVRVYTGALLDTSGFIYLFCTFRQLITARFWLFTCTLFGVDLIRHLALRNVLGSILFSSFSPFLILLCILFTMFWLFIPGSLDNIRSRWILTICPCRYQPYSQQPQVGQRGDVGYHKVHARTRDGY